MTEEKKLMEKVAEAERGSQKLKEAEIRNRALQLYYEFLTRTGQSTGIDTSDENLKRLGFWEKAERALK